MPEGEVVSKNTFKYELIILDPSLHKYIEATEETESFIKAVFNVLMRNRKLCDKILTIYCRKPKVRRFSVYGKIRWAIIQRIW